VCRFIDPVMLARAVLSLHAECGRMRAGLLEACDYWQSHIEDRMCSRPMAGELREMDRIAALRKLAEPGGGLQPPAFGQSNAADRELIRAINQRPKTKPGG